MEWWKSWLNRQDFKYSSVQRLSNLESYCAAAGWLTSVYCGWCVCAKLIISWQWIWREADSRNNNITTILTLLHTWTPEHGKTGLYPNHLHIGHTVSYFQPGSEVDCPQLGLAPLLHSQSSRTLFIFQHSEHSSWRCGYSVKWGLRTYTAPHFMNAISNIDPMYMYTWCFHQTYVI